MSNDKTGTSSPPSGAGVRPVEFGKIYAPTAMRAGFEFDFSDQLARGLELLAHAGPIVRMPIDSFAVVDINDPQSNARRPVARYLGDRGAADLPFLYVLKGNASASPDQPAATPYYDPFRNTPGSSSLVQDNAGDGSKADPGSQAPRVDLPIPNRVDPTGAPSDPAGATAGVYDVAKAITIACTGIAPSTELRLPFPVWLTNASGTDGALKFRPLADRIGLAIQISDATPSLAQILLALADVSTLFVASSVYNAVRDQPALKDVGGRPNLALLSEYMTYYGWITPLLLIVRLSHDATPRSALPSNLSSAIDDIAARVFAMPIPAPKELRSFCVPDLNPYVNSLVDGPGFTTVPTFRLRRWISTFRDVVAKFGGVQSQLPDLYGAELAAPIIPSPLDPIDPDWPRDWMPTASLNATNYMLHSSISSAVTACVAGYSSDASRLRELYGMMFPGVSDPFELHNLVDMLNVFVVAERLVMSDVAKSIVASMATQSTLWSADLASIVSTVPSSPVTLASFEEGAKIVSAHNNADLITALHSPVFPDLISDTADTIREAHAAVGAAFPSNVFFTGSKLPVSKITRPGYQIIRCSATPTRLAIFNSFLASPVSPNDLAGGLVPIGFSNAGPNYKRARLRHRTGLRSWEPRGDIAALAAAIIEIASQPAVGLNLDHVQIQDGLTLAALLRASEPSVLNFAIILASHLLVAHRAMAAPPGMRLSVGASIMLNVVAHGLADLSGKSNVGSTCWLGRNGTPIPFNQYCSSTPENASIDVSSKPFLDLINGTHSDVWKLTDALPTLITRTLASWIGFASGVEIFKGRLDTGRDGVSSHPWMSANAVELVQLSDPDRGYSIGNILEYFLLDGTVSNAGATATPLGRTQNRLFRDNLNQAILAFCRAGALKGAGLVSIVEADLRGPNAWASRIHEIADAFRLNGARSILATVSDITGPLRVPVEPFSYGELVLPPSFTYSRPVLRFFPTVPIHLRAIPEQGPGWLDSVHTEPADPAPKFRLVSPNRHFVDVDDDALRTLTVKVTVDVDSTQPPVFRALPALPNEVGKRLS